MTIALFSGEALALPPGPHSDASHFGQGIPVFWPYHAGLMIAGFLLLLTGFLVARYHKTKNWSRTHAVLQVCGAACVIAGVAVGVYMVTLSGFPSLGNIHEILGVATGLLILVTLVLGYSIRRITRAKNTVRQGHRWLGRIVICLMTLTIILGVYFLSLLLGR
jgi:heme A synthase